MAAAPTQTAARAEDFIQSIGVNTHVAASTVVSGSYSAASVVSDLRYLGVDHVRDVAPDLAHLAAFQSIGASGANFDLIVMGDLPQSMTDIDAMAADVSSVEGPNEVNVTLPHYAGLVGAAAAIAMQQAIYAEVHADPRLNGAGRVTPVLNFTVSLGHSYAPYGDMAAYADATNVHAYGQDGIPSYWFIPPEVRAVTDTPGKPVVITEAGNYTLPDGGSGVSEDVQAKLMLDTLLDDFSAGIQSTFLYQLEDGATDPNDDNSEAHYGLFHDDNTPKVAAVALHDLTSILADGSATAQSFAAATLAYSVTGLPSNGRDFLMQKSSGTFEIALWREPLIWDITKKTEISLPPNDVVVSLGAVYQTIDVYDPLAGAAPIATYHDVSSVQVALGTGPLVVEVAPGTSTLPATDATRVTTGAAGGIFNSHGFDTIVAGAGAATVNASGAATIIGSSGALTVRLTGQDDYVDGGAGAFDVDDVFGNNVIVTNNVLGVAIIDVEGGGDTIVANKANLAVSAAGNVSVDGGTGALTLNGGMGGGLGGDYVFTQTGTHNLLRLGGGDNVVLGHGADTIFLSEAPGAAPSYVYAAGPALVMGGAGALQVEGRGGAVTVMGGAGPLDATVSGDASWLEGGSLGGNALHASGSGDTLLGGGGGTLTDTGAGDNLLIAGGGAETLSAGTGNDTLFAGGGRALLVFTAAPAAHGDTVRGFGGGDRVTFAGFGTEAPITRQLVVGGNLMLTLADHSEITFVGVTCVDGDQWSR